MSFCKSWTICARCLVGNKMDATLQEILDARERRVQTQNALLAQYQKPVISFTMNIPGPEKYSREIAIGVWLGDRLLQQALQGVQVIHRQVRCESTGCEGYYVVDQPAQALKRLTVALEAATPLGRLFDMDVLDADGTHLHREALGLGSRKCLLCQEDAAICARSRAHGLGALLQRTHSLLDTAVGQMAQHIADTACLALEKEVTTTPKPGLVDENNSGAHRDMEIGHFFASIQALRPFFQRIAMEGCLTREQDASQVLPLLRSIGMEAEKAMLQATAGVNTHKGAIFSIGLLCAAAGRLSPEDWSADSLCAAVAAMAAGVTKELSGIKANNAATAGERIYTEYGITGVRGQAEAGFPAVLETGLPVLRKGLQQGLSLNDCGCATLLHLLAVTDDTNLIHRSDRQTQLQVKQSVADLLTVDPYPEKAVIQQLDREFIEKNLSPGGSADLLAATYFLHFL